MTDIFESLTRDHRDVEQLFTRYDETGDDAVAHQICDALTLHSEIEEQVLYPEIRRIVDGGDDLANVAEAEHATVRLLTERVWEAPPVDLHPLINELRVEVSHHVAVEEQELFPQMHESGVNAKALSQMADALRAEVRSRSSGKVG
jgi:iron-sulfur cluster repair protein YtfE (RIC family)